MSRLTALGPTSPFPPTSQALSAPNGLLAVGGDLSSSRLIAAYQRGIFPWFSPGEPILWWSPAPRCVFIPSQLHLSHSLKKFIKRCDWQLRANTSFERVIRACASVDDRQHNTWITEDIIRAYTALHQQGYAHSVEVWAGEQLIGGLYGVAMEHVFFAESMFSLQSNGSKVALARLQQQAPQLGIVLIDAQVPNPHLLSLGAALIERSEFEQQLPRQSTPLVASTFCQAITGAVSDLLSWQADAEAQCPV